MTEGHRMTGRRARGPSTSRRAVLVLLALVSWAASGCVSRSTVDDLGAPAQEASADAGPATPATPAVGSPTPTALEMDATDPRPTEPEPTDPQPAEPAPTSAAQPLEFASGAERLLSVDRSLLAGRRVGLIANPASQIDGRSVIDLFAAADDFELVALFAPEHGVRGDLGAGELVPGGTDPQTGVVVHSLYGDQRAPTAEQLASVDVLVYDLQDTGTRFYTFITTMGLAMQAAAEHDVDFVVADRPNPQAAVGSSGFVLDPAFASFVGAYPIPAAYALTPGELAEAIVGERWLDGLDGLRLTVVPLSNWTRSGGWTATGQAWIPPSPGLPTVLSAQAYPGTVLFETTRFSVARCTDRTFAAVADPDLTPAAMAEALLAAGFDGVSFAVETLTVCDLGDVDGASVVDALTWQIADPSALDAVEVGVHAIAAAEQALGAPVVERPEFFDLLAGTDRMRQLLESGATPAAVVEAWRAEAAAFDTAMAPYRRYDDG